MTGDSETFALVASGSVAGTPAAAEPTCDVLKVAIPVPLSRVFDYLPHGDLSDYQSGMRVRVPFGRGARIGVVLSIGTSAFARSKLKAVYEKLDQVPVIPAEIMRLVEWSSRYYHHPIGDAFAAALPVLLRQGSTREPEDPCNFALTAKGTESGAVQLARAPAQLRLLDFLRDNTDGVSAAECRLFDPGWSRCMHQLLDKGYVERVWPRYSGELPAMPFVLNEEQQLAAETISAGIGAFAATLLQGITGSGKTAVYLDAVRRVVADGRQVLFLVPEIGLTPQLVTRVRLALNCRVEVLHSGLNDTERLLGWMAASAGDASVVIGTRSAVFTPLPRLGLIVVDEEHDGSLKQQDGFRYHARDLALVRAREAGIPVVLGSATPSLESLHNVARKQFALRRLEQRAGGAQPPQIGLLDVRQVEVKEGISQLLLDAMREVLARGEQVIVFLNRRGFAPVLMCESCGAMADCDHCDAHMTVHAASARLRCHHCGSERPTPQTCATCETGTLIHVGAGTERIDEYLTEQLPDYKLLRIDRDSTSKKGELERKLAMAAEGEVQILVGTQMLAKGHDFPNVTLVGIIDADQGLFGADFRSVEQMGQLIVQVAGRAGRAQKRGRVVVQTRNPDSELLQTLIRDGYPAYAAALMNERKLAAWPPFVHIALLRADSGATGEARNYLASIREQVQQLKFAGVSILGPAHAPMERLAGRYRAQLLFTAQQRKPLHELLAWLRPTLESLPSSRRVRWSIDVDPHDML